MNTPRQIIVTKAIKVFEKMNCILVNSHGSERTYKNTVNARLFTIFMPHGKRKSRKELSFRVIRQWVKKAALDEETWLYTYMSL